MYPCVTVNFDPIRSNAQTICALCTELLIPVTAGTKIFCGDAPIAQWYADAVARMLSGAAWIT